MTFLCLCLAKIFYKLKFANIFFFTFYAQMYQIFEIDLPKGQCHLFWPNVMMLNNDSEKNTTDMLGSIQVNIKLNIIIIDNIDFLNVSLFCIKLPHPLAVQC